MDCDLIATSEASSPLVGGARAWFFCSLRSLWLSKPEKELRGGITEGGYWKGMLRSTDLYETGIQPQIRRTQPKVPVEILGACAYSLGGL